MNKILLVLQREYLTRVQKKSFIIMTILGPILIAAFYVGLGFIVSSGLKSEEAKIITVVDDTHSFEGKLQSSDKITFIFTGGSFEETKEQMDDFYAILHIPKVINKDNPKGIKLVSAKTPSVTTTNFIEGAIEKAIKEDKLRAAGINQTTLDSLKTNVVIEITDADENITSSAVNTGVGMFLAFAIYIFIFLYGVQVMKGVIEEKANRIVELIVSSIKPFQMMMGKILGIAAVGLTQFIIWILLSVVLISVATGVFGLETMQQNPQSTEAMAQMGDAGNLMAALTNLPITEIVLLFIFYFIGGYLLYSALFAAIAAAVDNETETQQFMFPITMPLIGAIVVAQSVVMSDPNSSVAQWLSYIPFTSPIVMVVRLPFLLGTPGAMWEIALSMVLLVAGFLFTTWIAARIYRTGILMYGKKITYKELMKWLFYRGYH